MFGTRRRTVPPSTVSTRSKGSLLSRLTGPRSTVSTRSTRSTRSTKPVRSTRASRRHAAPVATTHHRRRPSMTDKISGVLLRMKGKLTGRPGVTGAGTKRIRGTDGRGSRRTRAAPVTTTRTARRGRFF